MSVIGTVKRVVDVDIELSQQRDHLLVGADRTETYSHVHLGKAEVARLIAELQVLCDQMIDEDA